MSFELLFAYLEQILYRILAPFIDTSILQYSSEALKDGRYTSRRHLRENLATLNHEISCYLDGVLSGILQEESKKLQCQELMDDLLIN